MGHRAIPPSNESVTFSLRTTEIRILPSGAYQLVLEIAPAKPRAEEQTDRKSGRRPAAHDIRTPPESAMFVGEHIHRVE
jgi:hypothetical protein